MTVSWVPLSLSSRLQNDSPTRKPSQSNDTLSPTRIKHEIETHSTNDTSWIRKTRGKLRLRIWTLPEETNSEEMSKKLQVEFVGSMRYSVTSFNKDGGGVRDVWSNTSRLWLVFYETWNMWTLYKICVSFSYVLIRHHVITTNLNPEDLTVWTETETERNWQMTRSWRNEDSSSNKYRCSM